MSASPLALALARDLSLKLLERRAISATTLPEALSALAATGQSALLQSPPIPGLPILRLAGTLTATQIERGWLGRTAAVAESLSQNAQLLKEIASKLPPDRAKEILSLTLSLIVKLMETNGVSPSGWPAIFEELALTLGRLAEN
ncbi:MAG: hypothetical protein LBR11_09210 [Deltaproteobacteria bacterium]|nr:hypothetical protein [Deltaproteobacteria bacterium]